MKKIMVFAVAVVAGVSFADMTATNDTLQSTSAVQKTVGDVMSLNFNLPVDQVIDAYAELAEKTLLLDPSLPRSYITLKSGKGRKFTKEECLETLGAALEMNGVHLEPCGEKVIRVFPSRVALQNGIPIIMSPKPLEEKGRVVSVMIPFKNISAVEGCKSFEVFKTPTGVFCIFERTNSILVTDVDRNINRMLEIAKLIDITAEK